MARSKADTAESQFNAFGWPNREARSGVDPSVGWGLLGKHALTTGVRRFVVTLLSALLVGCRGDSNSGAYTAVATDPDGDALTYRLEGTDAVFFDISIVATNCCVYAGVTNVFI